MSYLSKKLLITLFYFVFHGTQLEGRLYRNITVKRMKICLLYTLDVYKRQ